MTTAMKAGEVLGLTPSLGRDLAERQIPETFQQELRALRRLAATPARDVREALEYALGSLRTIAGGWRNSSPGQLGAIAQAGIDLAELGPEKCAEMRGEASNLDAAAPAAGGETPDAWVVQLKYGPDRWSGDMLTDVLPSDTETYRIIRPLYAAPPLQAPAHSDAVRTAVDQIITSAMSWQPSEDGPSYMEKRADLEAMLNAALTAPVAKAGDNS